MQFKTAGAEPAGDRRDARRGDAARRERAPRREPGADRRPAHRRRVRPAPLGRDLRPRPDRHLRDPERRGAADRRPRSRPSCRRRGADRIHREPTDDVQAYQLYLQGQHCIHPVDAGGGRPGPPSTSSRRSPATPTTPWPTPRWRMAYTDMGLGVAGALPPDEAFHAGEGRRRPGARDRPRPRRGARGAGTTSSTSATSIGREPRRELKRAIELEPEQRRRLRLSTGCCSRRTGALRRGDGSCSGGRTSSTRWRIGMDIATTLLRAGPVRRGACAPSPGCSSVEPHLAAGARDARAGPTCCTGRPDEGIAALRAGGRALPRQHAVPGAARRRPTAWSGGPRRPGRCCGRLEELSRERYVSPYHMAYVYTGLGEHERAMDLLERAYEERAGAVFGMKGSFLFAPLRSHPRFTALLRKMNLVEA